jgi:hypothetical protein
VRFQNMARTTRRTSLSTLVPKTAIEKATFTLQDLPEKPKEELSLKEAVQNMREVISAALSKGYSLEEVAEMLTQQGVDITPPSLKYYLTRGIKADAAPTATRAKGRRGGRPKKATAEDSAPVEPPVEDEPVEDAKPKTTRRPRATNTRTAAKQTTRTSTRARAPKDAAEAPAKKTPGRRRKSEA